MSILLGSDFRFVRFGILWRLWLWSVVIIFDVMVTISWCEENHYFDHRDLMVALRNADICLWLWSICPLWKSGHRIQLFDHQVGRKVSMLDDYDARTIKTGSIFKISYLWFINFRKGYNMYNSFLVKYDYYMSEILALLVGLRWHENWMWAVPSKTKCGSYH